MPILMNIQINPATADDYERIKWWFEAREQQPHPSCMLPPVGLIASIDGEETACAWLYRSDGDCGVGFLHFVGTNPDASEARRAIALRRGMEGIAEKAREMGITVILGTISNPRFLKAAESLGWQAGQTTNQVAYVWDSTR